MENLPKDSVRVLPTSLLRSPPALGPPGTSDTSMVGCCDSHWSCLWALFICGRGCMNMLSNKWNIPNRILTTCLYPFVSADKHQHPCKQPKTHFD